MNSTADDLLVGLIVIFGQEFWAHGNRDPLLQRWYVEARRHLDETGVVIPFRDPVTDRSSTRHGIRGVNPL